MISVNFRFLINRLNQYCKRTLEDAAGLCVSRGSYEISIEHMLVKMIEDPDRDFQRVLRHYEIDPARVSRSIQQTVEKGKTGNSGKPVFSPLLIEWFEDAWLLASVEMNMGELRSGALVATLLINPNRYGMAAYTDELKSILPDDLRQNLLDITEGSKEVATRIEVEAQDPAGEAGPRGGDTALARFTLDFTGRARAGDIDPVFCRDREIRQMIDILGRRRKNNPIAVGEAGVGKTAVIEGLALKIVQGDVPDVLKDVEIYGLDLGLLQAGAGVKGEFENRLKSVISEIKSSVKPIILFIDEAHTLIGAGGQAGSGDAANLLKPALARGELRTVAATTWSEYKKYFEKDPALARRFQLVKLDEPSPEEAVVILRGLRETYEKAHGVYVRDDAVEAAARLSARYISGRQLPDKAVDVLDTAAARVKISISAKPDAIEDKERRVQTIERELGAIKRDVESDVLEDDGRIAALQEEVDRINLETEQLTSKWENERDLAARILELRSLLAGPEAEGSTGPESDAEADEREGREATPREADDTKDSGVLKSELDQVFQELAGLQEQEALVDFEVSPEVVGKVISNWTGIPLGKMVRDEAGSILQFNDDLRQRIKGQDHAVGAIDEGIRASKAGLANPDTPMGTFLFVGPSGVGKTEAALGVADLLFGGERFMVTINMSEFQEKHTVSRLIGSPPGYVGFGEGGVLTEGVRQRPYSVVLLDEVEKADLEVMNLFYQVFDKGRLSDGEGRVIDFRNTICFLTSNLASDIITQMCAGDEWPDAETLGSAIRPVLSAHFKPALLARMTIVPFFPLSKNVMGDIVELKLAKVGKRLTSSHKMDFKYTPEVIARIAERCTEVETGARNIDHIINGTLLPRISTEILQQMSDEGMPDLLQVGLAENGDFALSFSNRE
ncbi:MAG: type VI secretion system ATPase TssH [Gammaproteobacteria bacterium]|nr:type VI secretion system ATPase TssH [Gammaproteobacteria bacterium]